jgi:hypothetical protein
VILRWTSSSDAAVTIFRLLMISNSSMAREINELMLDLFRRVDESVQRVKETCPPEEAAAYQKATGRVACPIVMDVLEPLYERHPALKPPNWDEEESSRRNAD